MNQIWHLRAWRRHRKLSQEALAEKMRTSKGQISKLERYQLFGPGKGQKFNDEWLGRYCVALDVTPQELWAQPGTRRSIDDLLKDAPMADQARLLAAAEAFIKPNK
jgi:transcriptional regulator with XRE-family HTH domain